MPQQVLHSLLLAIARCAVSSRDQGEMSISNPRVGGLLYCRRVRGLWRYNHTSAYIASRITATAKDVNLNIYRANRSECGAGVADSTGAAGGLAAATGRVEPAADHAALAEKSLAVSNITLQGCARADAIYVCGNRYGGSQSRQNTALA